MIWLIVFLTVIAFVSIDLLMRLVLRKREEVRLQKERQEALDLSLRLEFADEAASLKRAEVNTPKAKILAVDDEPVVLDSFRKILVLEGFSVDTVETGPEALGLVRKNEYDFVFTDLKMPQMDGLEVTKAVKHLRPDVDVVMITGYATIESAVDAMKFGAMDYVQKPFSADELADFARKLLIRRQDRIERQTSPVVQLVTSNSMAEESARVINVPGGIYVSAEHVWVGVEINGEARVGLDDFVRKTLVEVDEIEFPEKGRKIAKGKPLFSIKRGGRLLTFLSPLSGKVSRINYELDHYLDVLTHMSFADGWICSIQPDELGNDLTDLKIGAEAIPIYEGDVRSFHEALGAKEAEAGTLEDEARKPEEVERARRDRAWEAFADCFLNKVEE
jgi:CheY-like chemotaxis protein